MVVHWLLFVVPRSRPESYNQSWRKTERFILSQTKMNGGEKSEKIEAKELMIY